MISFYLLVGTSSMAIASAVVVHVQTFVKSNETFTGDVLDSCTENDSHIRCAARCELSPRCRVAKRHVVNSTCILYENYTLITNMTEAGNRNVSTYFKEPRSCTPGWSAIGDFCYIGINISMKWSEALDACNSTGASLVTITSQVEHEAIRNVRVDPKKPVWVGGQWISNGTDRQWQWENGEEWKFENFHHTQLSYDPEKDSCLVSHDKNRKNKWFERDCSRRFAFICEMKISGK